MERVTAYVDGFNFYHGLMAKGWGRYRWLDYHALMTRCLRDGQELAAVKLFTTLRSHPPDRYARHKLYLDALRSHSQVEAIFGKHTMKPQTCPECGETYKRVQEKRTDVAMATEIIADAYRAPNGTAWVVSADSDLIPALVHVRDTCNTRVVLMDPPARHSDEMNEMRDRPWFFARRDLNQCQLPPVVEYLTGRKNAARYERPPEWM